MITGEVGVYMLASPSFFCNTMEYTLAELKQAIFKNVLDVYDIFVNRFGEEYVDIHGLPTDSDLDHRAECTKVGDRYDVSKALLKAITNSYIHHYSIYVWWPKVTVTNENDRSIDIQDLYAKVTIDINGMIPYEQHGFTLNRATYPAIQFDSNYMHSHISCIPRNSFSEFQNPCLGRGPIRSTIVTLKSNNDTAMWMLFCEELARYVTVESLTGIPYKKLEQVGRYNLISNQDFALDTDDLFKCVAQLYAYQTNSLFYLSNDNLRAKLKEFTAYYLKHGHLKFSYRQRKFVCGMTFYEYLIDISNCFIEYYNKALARNKEKKEFLYNIHVLNEVLVADSKFYKLDSNHSHYDYSRYRNSYVLTFKDKDIKLNIIEDNDTMTVQRTTVLHHNIANYILNNILKIINFRFQNGHNKNNSSFIAQADKTVCYL